MPHPPTPSDFSAGDLPWEAFKALAANELRADEARALRAQIMHPMPSGLLARVMDALPVASAPQLRLLRWPQLAAGWAAAVLLSLAGWVAVASAAPALAANSPAGVQNVTLVAALQSLPAGLSEEGDLPHITASSILASGDSILASGDSMLASGDGPSRGVTDAWPWLLGGSLLLGVGLAGALGAHRRAGQGRAAQGGL